MPNLAIILYLIPRAIVEPDKGHNRNNLRTKDKLQCTKWRLSYSSNILFLTSDKGQPLNKGQNNGSQMCRFPLYQILTHTSAIYIIIVIILYVCT